ncbi:MAG: hypothetical protein Q7T67_05695, partial [Patulibacter sp.]|nr:hypothetical protein [Patulibacter sp.]
MSPRGRRGGGERSEDDRQQARLEREQRRAQREGRPVPRSLEDLPVAEPSESGAPSDTFRPAGPVGDAPVPADPADPADPAGRRERLAALRAGIEEPTDGGATGAGPSVPDRQDRRDVGTGGGPPVAAPGANPAVPGPDSAAPRTGPAGPGADPVAPRADSSAPDADPSSRPGARADEQRPVERDAPAAPYAPAAGRPWWSTDGQTAPPPPAGATPPTPAGRPSGSEHPTEASGRPAPPRAPGAPAAPDTLAAPGAPRSPA